MTTNKHRLTGQLTIASAAATILGGVFLVLFFMLGGVFGPLNDVVSIFQVLLMVPALVFFYRALRQSGRGLATVGFAFGVAGIAVSAITQILLVVGVLPYVQTVAPNMIGGGMVGVWLVVVNGLAMRIGLLKGALPWAGIAAGVGYILLVIGFSIGGQENLLFQIGGGLALIAFTTWAIWLGLAMIRGNVSIPEPAPG